MVAIGRPRQLSATQDKKEEQQWQANKLEIKGKFLFHFLQILLGLLPLLLIKESFNYTLWKWKHLNIQYKHTQDDGTNPIELVLRPQHHAKLRWQELNPTRISTWTLMLSHLIAKTSILTCFIRIKQFYLAMNMLSSSEKKSRTQMLDTNNIFYF